MTAGPTLRTWAFTIPGQAQSANADHRASRWAVVRERAQWKADAFYAARAAKVPWLGTAKVELTIHLRNHSRADPQNYPSASSVKGLLDGLVLARVIADDRPPFLELPMPTITGLDGGQPRIHILIREVER